MSLYTPFSKNDLAHSKQKLKQFSESPDRFTDKSQAFTVTDGVSIVFYLKKKPVYGQQHKLRLMKYMPEIALELWVQMYSQGLLMGNIRVEIKVIGSVI